MYRICLKLAIMKDYGLKYKAMFMTVYGGGLRVSKLCNLRIQERKKAGITRKVTVHGLRRNFATDLIENGLDILIIKN